VPRPNMSAARHPKYIYISEDCVYTEMLTRCVLYSSFCLQLTGALGRVAAISLSRQLFRMCGTCRKLLFRVFFVGRLNWRCGK
jgi:hypothetical protein